jgi:hypothetical protein
MGIWNHSSQWRVQQVYISTVAKKVLYCLTIGIRRGDCLKMFGTQSVEFKPRYQLRGFVGNKLKTVSNDERSL